MIHIRTAEEIELLHQAAQVVSRTLGILAKEVKPKHQPKTTQFNVKFGVY